MRPEPQSSKLRAIRWSTASKYSPWPDRFAGRTAWSKARRTRTSILEEYDRGRYQATLRAWREFKASRLHEGKRLERGSVLDFEAAEFGRIARSLDGQRDLYGAKAAATALVSIARDLFLADRQDAIQTHYSTVRSHLGRVAVSANCDTLVELGCGSGVNLVRALYWGFVADAFGGELSPNARQLLDEIAAATDLPLHSFPVDLNAPANVDDLPLAHRSWLLLTVHAVEQLGDGAGDMVDGVLGLRNRPRRVLHLEPIAPETDNAFDDDCRTYTEMNRYNSDLVQVLEERQARGKIRILDVRRRLFGLQAFNPTSLVEWEPT